MKKKMGRPPLYKTEEEKAEAKRRRDKSYRETTGQKSILPTVKGDAEEVALYKPLVEQLAIDHGSIKDGLLALIREKYLK